MRLKLHPGLKTLVADGPAITSLDVYMSLPSLIYLQTSIVPKTAAVPYPGRVGSADLIGGVSICSAGEGDKAVVGGKMAGAGDE